MDNPARIALAGLFSVLTEEQQNRILKQIMFSVNKHELEGVDEREAVEILRGY